MTTNKNNLIQTEIGLYPADWTIIRVKELFSEIKRGYVLPVSATKSRPSGESIYPVYSSQTANNGVMGFYDTYLYEDAITWTTDGANAGDVHFRAGKFYCTNVCGVLISNKGFANRCTAEAINRVSRNHVSYIGNPKLMNNVMAEIQIAIPSTLEEQLRIASALSTIDAYIRSLDDLIVKKRQIKEGLMQQLLTGKTRLPGFSGKWEERRLDSFEIVNGSMLKSSAYETGNVPVIAGGQTPAGFHSKANRPANTITISGSGAYAGFVSFHKVPIFASDCSTIENPKNADIIYLYFCLLSKQNDIYKCQAGGAQPHVHAKDIKDITILMPSSIEEQKAISVVLTKSDDEINGLKAQRDKYALIKQGMMQELLTGKTRLI